MVPTVAENARPITDTDSVLRTREDRDTKHYHSYRLRMRIFANLKKIMLIYITSSKNFKNSGKARI